MTLAGAGLSIVAMLSIAAPASAQSSSPCCSMAAGPTRAASGPGVQHDHAVQGAAPGAVANVDADVARLLARVDETTGDERMAVMTELITLLVQDRAARQGTAASAPAGMLMSEACAERQATGGEAMGAMCAEHQASGGGQPCPMCAEHQAAGSGSMCAMCAQHAGAADHTAGAPANAPCCAGHK